MIRTTHLVPALLAALALVPFARAADNEGRSYNVTVDGKDSGNYTIKFVKDKGDVTIGCIAQVKVKVGFITAYHYDYTGTEVWKDGRLVTLNSTCNDDGKK